MLVSNITSNMRGRKSKNKKKTRKYVDISLSHVQIKQP